MYTTLCVAYRVTDRSQNAFDQMALFLHFRVFLHPENQFEFSENTQFKQKPNISECPR